MLESCRVERDGRFFVVTIDRPGVMKSEDFLERPRAFADKRKPNFMASRKGH